MRRIATGVVSIALLTFPDLAGAKPDAVPVFNIEPSCQEARSFIGSDKNLAYQACMKDENDARAELARKWTHFKPEDRKDCVAQGATPMPSYVEILTCLEMSAEANALYNPDGSARAKPLPTSQGLSSPQPAAPASNLPGPVVPEGSVGPIVAPPAGDLGPAAPPGNGPELGAPPAASLPPPGNPLPPQTAE
jgi:hypothetical protein